MPNVSWIKLSTDIFVDEKIRLIEKMPEGETILVIWLKLLVLAGKTNDRGRVYLTESIPYTPDMLEDIMGRDSRIISLALNTFTSFNMIEIVDDVYEIVNWEKHQNIDGLDDIRKKNRERQKRFRERKKAMQIEDKSVTLPVTLDNAVELELEKDKEIEKETEKISDPARIEAKKLAMAWYSIYFEKTLRAMNPSEDDISAAFKLLKQTDFTTAESQIKPYFECSAWFVVDKKTKKRTYSFRSFCKNFTEIPEMNTEKPIENEQPDFLFGKLTGAGGDE